MPVLRAASSRLAPSSTSAMAKSRRGGQFDPAVVDAFVADPAGVLAVPSAGDVWATETVGDPRYPLSLLLRVITVSLETTKMVRTLPALVMEGE